MNQKTPKKAPKNQSNPLSARENGDDAQKSTSNTARQMVAAYQKAADKLQPPRYLRDLANLTDRMKVYDIDPATLKAIANAGRLNTAAIARINQITQPVSKARELARRAVSLPETSLHAKTSLKQEEFVATSPILSALDIGQLVRIRRKAKKLSQQAFADMAGVGRRFISELENGKATLEFDKVLKVAAAAGLDLSARERG